MNAAEVHELLPHRATQTAAFKNRPAGAKRTKLLKSSKSKEWQKKALLPIAKWVVPLFNIILIYHPPLCGLRLWWQLQSHITIPMGRKKASQAVYEHSNPSLLGVTEVPRRRGCMLSPPLSPLRGNRCTAHIRCMKMQVDGSGLCQSSGLKKNGESDV